MSSQTDLSGRVPVNIASVLLSSVLILTAGSSVKKFRSNSGNRCSLVAVPRPVLVAVETWRSTSLQIPVQTFPQFFREQTVNRKVGTNVLLFSINSSHSFRQRIALRKENKPTFRIQVAYRATREPTDRSNTPQSFEELLSCEIL